MTAAERQRWRRIRQAEVVATMDTEQWTEAHCLSILNGLTWRGGPMDKAAWQQLGKLRGFT